MITKCIRVDHEDGSESVVPIKRAFKSIDGCYRNSLEVKGELIKGQTIRTLFATYRVEK